MPHAGIEPAAFCLQDRRSAPEPMRLTVLLHLAFEKNLTHAAELMKRRNIPVTIIEFWPHPVLAADSKENTLN